MRIIAGLDGCPTGWVCITRELDSGRVGATILPNIAQLLVVKPRPIVAMVDVPIGLTDAGPRVCDRLARSLLKAPRASSVFPAPIRPVLRTASYSSACQVGCATDGRKLSKQAWNICPKIREVDDVLAGYPARQRWIREVHPELCFWAWNGNQPMVHRKKSSAGRAEREALVMAAYGNAYADAQATLPRRVYGNDDLLDAFAALWTAERFIAGRSMTIPDDPPVDSRGLQMEMIV
jgi:predicted RNase H-like nuclease